MTRSKEISTFFNLIKKYH